MTKVVIIARIGNMGEKKKVITIPKDYWQEIKPLEDIPRIRVTLEDNI